MKKILIPVALLFALTNCKKKTEDPAPAPIVIAPAPTKSVPSDLPTQTSLITAHIWKVEKFSVSGIYDTKDCDRDDTYLFKTNGDVVSDAGATKCEPSSPQTSTDKWILVGNKKIVITDGTISKDTFDIAELTDSRFEVNSKYKTGIGSETVNGTIVFKK